MLDVVIHSLAAAKTRPHLSIRSVFISANRPFGTDIKTLKLPPGCRVTAFYKTQDAVAKPDDFLGQGIHSFVSLALI